MGLIRTLVFSLLFVASVLALNPQRLESLDIRLTVAGELIAVGDVEFAEANLSLVPIMADHQRIVAQRFDPIPRQTAPLSFTWNDGAGTYPFVSTYDLEMQRNAPHISVPLSFPIETPTEVQNYLVPQRIIDADHPAIQTLSKQLMIGQEDLGNAVHTIAVWVMNNIAYDLSTANVQASVPASKVLQQRNGVCDELTSLFIALLRAAGIPARFVSGIAYTNSPLFAQPWGAHGWAEVYFPSIGWVPYDLTYEELGWVDPAHVVVAYTADADALQLDYAWSGDGQVRAAPLRIDAEILDQTSANQEVSIAAEPFHAEVGFGSFNLITVTLHNLQPYDRSVPVRFAHPPELSLLGPDLQFARLTPTAEAKLHWFVRVPSNLQEGYQYRYPLQAMLPDGTNSSAEFMVTAQAPVFVREDFPQEQAPTMTVYCMTSKMEYRQHERISLQCDITPKLQDQILLCLGTECHPTTNGRVQFSLTAGSAGNYALPVRVSTSVGSIATTATFAVLDEPVLEIANVTAPSTVGFVDTLSVEFFVRKRSFSPGYNVSIAVGSFDQITVPVLDTDRQLTFVILGADLDVGQNSIPLQVKWHDDEGKKYSVETEITIDLLPQNFWQRILLLLRDMERWIRSLGN